MMSQEMSSSPRSGAQDPPAIDVSVVAAVDGDASAWRAFVGASPEAEFGHRWDFLDLLGGVFGQRSVRLVAKRGESWVGVLPLVVQKSFLGTFLTSVPYLNYAGVLAVDRSARQALAAEAVDEARRLRADRLELRGRTGSDLPIEVWPGKCRYVLGLADGLDAVERALGAKLRSQIKRPLKEGYTARVVGAGGRRLFYPLLAWKWRDLGSPVLPEAFFERLEAVFGDDLAYAVVERDGRPAAAGALLRNGARMEIPWAASLRDHDRFGVNMLVYWTAIEFAAAQGSQAFDLGRSTPGTGNARFKLQWGATESTLDWNVWTPAAKGRAMERGDRRRALMAAAWRRLPPFVTGRLGPFLAARIPY